MKIEFRIPAGSGDYSVLADEAANSDRVSGFRPAFRKEPYVDVKFQSATKLVDDVGNAHWELQFAVDREHASQGAALSFIATHAALFAAIGKLDLKVTIPATPASTVINMAGCVVSEISPDPYSDKTTVISYAFIGPTFTVS